MSDSHLIRLQRILSQAGVTSRRKSEELILAGRVRVNDRVVRELGSKADPGRDRIEVDGVRIRPQQPRIAVLLNKPDGCITSLHDPHGRRTVAQLVADIPVRLYPVGRLDYHTEGLLILTNDGDLTQAIEHPSGVIEKVYLAKVKGIPQENDLERLRRGVLIEGRRTLPGRIRAIQMRKNRWFEIAIREGRQNQIRKMFESIGHPVLKLRRVAIGSLRDPHLKAGEYRMLTNREIEKFLPVTQRKQRRK